MRVAGSRDRVGVQSAPAVFFSVQCSRDSEEEEQAVARLGRGEAVAMGLVHVGSAPSSFLCFCFFALPCGLSPSGSWRSAVGPRAAEAGPCGLSLFPFSFFLFILFLV